MAFAHPDSLKLFGHLPSCSLEPYYKRLAAALAQSGMYAEQNSGIFRRHGARLGMEPPLLQEMKRIGVRIQTASDAHHPSEVGLGISGGGSACFTCFKTVIRSENQG